ncbi:MAG TPA: aldehyde dehydrogenase family protein, partial [Acidimicrobiales bacterium]|nr:aldehyde dehydrogenase family protein [Acidimicrobiales bacterium]
MSFLDPQRWNGKIFTGNWVETGRYLPATEPATGKELATVGAAGRDELATSAQAAATAGRTWATTSYYERAEVLRRAADLVHENVDELRWWLQRESGKVRAPAELELSLAEEEIRQAITLTTQPWAQLLQTSRPGRTSMARRVPLGVVAVIAPWNFPLNLALRSVAPALACGNAVILKPASETVVCCGVTVARLFEEAGLPGGVLHMLPGKGSDLGTSFADDPNVDMVSFTGSTPVGKNLGEAAGRHLVRMVAELGGNNPFVVLDDADVEAAAQAGAYGSFTHQGQICMAIGRHLVAESIADQYVDALAAAADSLTVGDPTDDVDLGPVINQSQVDHIDDIVGRTVDAGAALRAGGTRDGLFVRPAVLAGVSKDMPAFTEEIFGPVAPVTTFSDDDEAVQLANATPYGLVAAVHSRSVRRALSVGDRLEVGMVHVNDQTVNDEVVAPFGGRGDSGTGAFGTLT